MDLNTAWFLIIAFLLAGYAVLDGFDLGVGVLHLLARDDRQRQIHIAAIGPVWDGNEVWLIAAGGAMFAAFPPLYATIFSGFYLAFMILLFALIFRAVSIEFRGQVDDPRWRRFWDFAFGFGSLLPPVIFGVAVGNVTRGLPVEAGKPLDVSLLALLNPYALLIGVLTLVMFVMHGAVFLAARTEGDLQARLIRWATGAWAVFALLCPVAMLATYFVSPCLFGGVLAKPLFWILLVILVAAVCCVPAAIRAGRPVRAFFASALTIASITGLFAFILYPRLVLSSIDPDRSLTIYNASSTAHAMAVMLYITMFGGPLVIAYTAYVYKIFMGKVVVTEDGY